MDTLLIRLGHGPSHQNPESQVDWLVIDGNYLPVEEGSSEDLVELASLAAQRRVVVLLPAEEILLARVQLKARNRQQLLKAVPYTLEEDLADDVEDLHFAVASAPDREGNYAVAVVSRASMDAVLEALRTAGISPDFATAETLCLPFDDGGWSLLLEDQQVTVRTGGQAGFGCDPDNLSMFLNHALGEQEIPPDRLRIFRCTRIPISITPLDHPVDQVDEDLCPPRLFALGLDEGQNAINLLQGLYQMENPLLRRLRPWRAAAVLLTAWIALQTGMGAWDYLRLKREEGTLRQEIESLYRSTFPDASRIVNPRIQMEQRLRELSASQDPSGGKRDIFSFLRVGAQAIKAASGVRVDDIVYRGGRLEIALTASDLQSIEGIKQAIQQGGFEAVIQSADTSGTRVNARLLIQRART